MLAKTRDCRDAGHRNVKGTQHTNINLIDALLAHDAPHPVGKLQSHVLATAVDGNAVHVDVCPGQVQVFKQVGRVGLHLHNLAELGNAALLDEDSLAGQDIDNVLEPKLRQGDRFRGEEIISGALESLRRSRPEAQGSDAVLVTTPRPCQSPATRGSRECRRRKPQQNVPEAENAEACNHGSAGKGTLAPGVDLAEGGKDIGHAGARLAEFIEGIGEDVESEGRTCISKRWTACCLP